MVDFKITNALTLIPTQYSATQTALMNNWLALKYQHSSHTTLKGTATKKAVRF